MRQCGPLHILLHEAETFHWEFLDLQGFESVLNWYIMSCDPRVLLPLPARCSIDSSIVHLFHVAANYTPESGAFHKDTSKKRIILLKALVRLLTNSAARHKSLLTSQLTHFTQAYKDLFSHLESTLDATVQQNDINMAAVPLCSEIIATISHGASSGLLQEICRTSLVQWIQSSRSSSLLKPLLYATSHKILLLNHRCILIDTLITTLFQHDTMLRWSEVVELLHFPPTSPAPLIALATQVSHS